MLLPDACQRVRTEVSTLHRLLIAAVPNQFCLDEGNAWKSFISKQPKLAVVKFVLLTSNLL